MLQQGILQSHSLLPCCQRGKGGAYHLKGGKRSWGTHSVTCVSGNYKGWEESNYLKATAKP